MIPVKVELILNKYGFSGQDVEEMLSDESEFILDYYPTVGLQRFPSAVDSTYYVLTVGIGAAIGSIAGGFLNKFGEDLYDWIKSYISKVFSTKTMLSPQGMIEISFHDTKLNLYATDIEELLVIFKDLEGIKERVLITKLTGSLYVDFDKENGILDIYELTE